MMRKAQFCYVLLTGVLVLAGCGKESSAPKKLNIDIDVDTPGEATQPVAAEIVPTQVVWDEEAVDMDLGCLPIGRYSSVLFGEFEDIGPTTRHSYCWRAAAGEMITVSISTSMQGMQTWVEGAENWSIPLNLGDLTSSADHVYHAPDWVTGYVTTAVNGLAILKIEQVTETKLPRNSNWYEIRLDGFPVSAATDSEVLEGQFLAQIAPATNLSNTRLRQLTLTADGKGQYEELRGDLNSLYYSSRTCRQEGAEGIFHYRYDGKYVEIRRGDGTPGEYYLRHWEQFMIRGGYTLVEDSSPPAASLLACAPPTITSAFVSDYGADAVTVAVYSEASDTLVLPYETVVDFGHGVIDRQAWTVHTVHTTQLRHDVRIRAAVRGQDNLFSDIDWISNKPADIGDRTGCYDAGYTDYYLDGNDTVDAAVDIFAWPFSFGAIACDVDVYRMRVPANQELYIECRSHYDEGACGSSCPDYNDMTFTGSFVGTGNSRNQAIGTTSTEVPAQWIDYYPPLTNNWFTATVPAAGHNRILYLTIDGYNAWRFELRQANYSCTGEVSTPTP